VDVRTDGERERGYIPGSKHIPLQKLRQRYHELPKDRMIITYCQSGQRSYNASRFLQQHGYTVKNLSGGYLTWHAAQSLSDDKIDSPEPNLACLSQSDCSAGATK
jgi:rhodanese-related sulfurtransferase